MRRAWMALGAAALLGGCAAGSKRPPLPAPPRVAEVPAGDTETLVFIVGDAGDGRDSDSPLMRRLQQEVEAWSCRLARDGAVAVVYLGDNIYPAGLHEPGHQSFDGDTAALNSQARVVAGPCAKRHRTAAYFIAGNHDWGKAHGLEGKEQLRRQEVYLDSIRATGTDVSLRPRAGIPGPEVVDVGRRLRLVFIDTAWWMLAPTGTQKALLQGDVYVAMNTAGERDVIIAAHHPWQSGGPHGGGRSFWETLGVEFLLSRSGAWLQDLHSGPYRDFVGGLEQVFREAKPPLLFAGGHEHSLQVLRGTSSVDPRHILVSGSGSKVTEVGFAEGQVFRRAAPGWARVVFRRSGPVDLFIDSTDEGKSRLHCPSDANQEKCMADGAASFSLVHSQRLKP